MKKYFVLFGLLMFAASIMLQAQDKKVKLTREQKQELQQQEEEALIKLIAQCINDSTYVLEADYLGNRQGQRVSVSSTINFISVNKETAIFQFGSAYSAGYNGVGGATVEGTINKYEVSKRKKGGSYFVRISISTNVGFFDITLDIGATGMTSATVNANSRFKLNYSGKIVPISNSSIYKGMSL